MVLLRWLRIYRDLFCSGSSSAGLLRDVCVLLGARLALIAMVLPPIVSYAQVAVSDGGAATYTYPITVPPGVAGMSPKVGIFYTGGGVNGPLGYGWSIQGISLITRCPPMFSVDGVRTGVTYTATDKLCLDGQRLIQTDANGGTSGVSQSNDALGISSGYHEFRTEKDTYARIRGYGISSSDANNGYAYFKVWTKSGQVYEYGASPSATPTTNGLIAAQGKTVVAAWAVSRISDTLGNYIDFKYTQRSYGWGSGTSTTNPLPGFEWNLGEIQYSGNKVVFDYIDDRTDKSEAYHLGSKNVSIARLSKITTYINAPSNKPPDNLGPPAGSIAVKTIKLSYDASSTTGRARLSTITECAGTTTYCSPPTVLSYSVGGSTSSYVANSQFATSALATTTLQNQAGTLGVLMADFNGDGRMDFIRWSEKPSQNQLYTSNGDGTFTLSTTFNLASSLNSVDEVLFKSDGCYFSQVVDINGDGFPDILRFSTNASSGGTCSSSSATPGKILLYINDGSGVFSKTTYNGPTLLRTTSVRVNCDANHLGCDGVSKGINFFLIDVNGDGKLDIVTSLQPAYSYGSSDPCLTQVCTTVNIGDGAGNFTSVATNLAHKSVYVPPFASNTYLTASGFGAPRNVIDVNGDGLNDLAGVATAFNNIAAYTSNGDGNFTPGGGGACTYPMDFNGDGRADCLVTTGTIASNALFVTTGAGSSQVAGFNLTQTGNDLSGSGIGFVFGDFNGDGRQDILRYENDPALTALYLSKGDGTFSTDSTFKTFNTAANQLQTSDGTTSFVTGDFSGRGSIEILRFKDGAKAGAATSNQLFTKVDPVPADMLIGVQSSMGLTTKLSYRPLSNSSNPVGTGTDLRYMKDGFGGLPGAIGLAVPMYVVTEQTTDALLTGGGYANVSRYRYGGLKADLAGRGLLGFKKIDREMQAPNGNLVVSTTYFQIHPYIGVASSSTTSVGTLNSIGQQISSTTNVYCDQTSNASPSSAWSLSPCTTTSKVQRPYLYSSTETASELSTGTALPTVTTTNTFNGSGDPLTITTTSQIPSDASTLFTKITTNTYQADQTSGDAWVLGRLGSASVRSTVPNTIPTPGAGSAANATATAGATPNGALPPAPPSISAAQLMSIIQLLLLED